jgi:hypothetical protein
VTRYRWFLIVALTILGGLSYLVAQDPGVPTAYIWVRDAVGNHFVPVTAGVTVAADHKSATIAAGKNYVFETGLASTEAVPGTVRVSVDTAYVLYRTAPPAGPGSCSTGTGAIAAATDGYLYMCVPDGTSTGFRWARSPMETSW